MHGITGDFISLVLNSPVLRTKMNLVGIIRFAYKKIIKPVFFRLDPEFVHDRVINIGNILTKVGYAKSVIRSIFSYQNPILEQELFGLQFKNPVGLSAGFDKNGQIFRLMKSVGFGFAEVGTVTYKEYKGNPKPRLFRLPKSKGLVVYYGLKNQGSKKVISRLSKYNPEIPQIISIGRTNSKEASCYVDGLVDFQNGVREFSKSGVGDVYEINISCPNTYGGEPFTDPKSLEDLLKKVTEETKKPILLKMPINLNFLDFKKLVDVAIEYKVSALVIGNLNKDRKDILDTIPDNVKGNISGKPTEELSNELIRQTHKYAGDKIKIIGAGGIFNAEDAYKKIKLGASLVELITGMIYEGPQLIGEINRDLVMLLKRDDFKNISEAVGVEV